MNFSKLIADGVYKEEDLTKEEKSYVNGMRQAIEHIDGCIITEEECENTLDKIKMEIINEFIEKFKESFNIYIDEFIVCIQDERAE